MSRLARWIAPAALAGGLVAGLVAIPAAQASSATSIISINATSPHYPRLTHKDHGKVDGYAVVVYKDGAAATGVVTGTVTTMATTDTAQLMKEQFGQKRYTDVGTPEPLTTVNGTTASFSFSVTPSLATHYKVQLAGADTELSSAVTVYVTAGGKVPQRYEKVKCNASVTRCVLSLRDYVILPASAYKTESRKHVYLYMAIGDPTAPKNYTLSKSARASKAKRVNAGEFYKTFTWTIRGHFNASTVPYPNACTKDTESKDGMGLPDHHGCGNKKVPTSSIYLG